MEAKSKELSKGRKKRVMPAGLATPEEIRGLALLSSHPLHKSTKVRRCSCTPCIRVCKPFGSHVGKMWLSLFWREVL
jgi:hypothetical protein